MKPEYYIQNIQYDSYALAIVKNCTRDLEQIESYLRILLINGRSRQQAFDKLEEAMMWINKAIRDDQIERNVNEHS